METFIVITELAEPTGISIEEARAEIETCRNCGSKIK